MRPELLASLLADEAVAAARVPWACPCDFGPGGRYRLEELIGAGPRALVYRAVDTHMCSEGFRATVAVKVFQTGGAGDHEALTGRRVSHPAVLAVLDRGTAEDGSGYVVVEYAAGGDLSQRAVPMAPRDAVRLTARLSRGVQAAHSAGVVHCDLKPANVLLTAEGEPKLADFDLALRAGMDTGGRRGNAAFMSPEQFRGDAEAHTPPADLYALGGLLYYTLTGKLPHGETAAEVEAIHSEGRTVPATGLDRTLDRILARATALDREARYHSAGELADDLQRWLDREPIAWVHRRAPDRVILWARRRPVQAAALATLLAVGLAGGSAWAYAREKARAAQEQSQTEAVRIADENVNETKSRVRALIRGFAQSALGGNTEDRILPALVWLDWLGRSPVLAEKGDAPTAAERVNILRVLIDSADSTGRAGQLDDAMARYALAHLLVSVGDPGDAAEAAGLAAQVRQAWSARLPADDSFLEAVWGVEQAALALGESKGDPAAARARLAAARARITPDGRCEPVVRLLDRTAERVVGGGRPGTPAKKP